MSDNFAVLPHELERAAEEIAERVQGVNAREIDKINGNVAVYGTESVDSAMSEFCEAMGIAIPMLTKKCESTTDGLRQSAQHYRDTDARAKGHIDHARPDPTGEQQ